MSDATPFKVGDAVETVLGNGTLVDAYILERKRRWFGGWKYLVSYRVNSYNDNSLLYTSINTEWVSKVYTRKENE